MKESITKFDLEAAFKALDEIEMPRVKGMRPNRMNLAESTKRVDGTSLLIEDYYDLQDNNDLQEASDEREAEVAQAKLARIEKIVDLNAKSPDELLPSYAGKAIIQCPQCMNIFFKEQSDIEGQDGDIKTVQIGDTVNAGEICQHCGNDTGYIFSGWVEAEKPQAEEEPAIEEPVEAENELGELPEEPENEVEELPEEEPNEETEEEVELEEIPEEELPEEEPEEEEKKEESFIQPTGEALNEHVETALTEAANDLDKKLAEHNEYIEVLQAEIKKEEEAVKEAKNDFIKKMHEENLESLKAALDEAIPDEVKAEVEELPEADEIPEEELDEGIIDKIKQKLQQKKQPANKQEQPSEPSPEVKQHRENVYFINFKNDLLDAQNLQEFSNTWDKINYVYDSGYLSAETVQKLINDKELNAKDHELRAKHYNKNKNTDKPNEIPEEVKESLKEADNYIKNAQKHAKEIGKISTEEAQKEWNDFNFDKHLPDDEAEQVIYDALMAKIDGINEALTPEEQARLDEISKGGVIRAKDRYEFQELSKKAKEPKLQEADRTEAEVMAEIENDPEVKRFLDAELSEPISDEDVEGMFSEEYSFENLEDFDEASFDKQITEYLNTVYKNVNNFKTTSCQVNEKNLIIEGKINFKSGKSNNTKFIFEAEKYNKNFGKVRFNGINEEFSRGKAFKLTCTRQDNDKMLFTESIDYKYFINESLVTGSTKR